MPGTEANTVSDTTLNHSFLDKSGEMPVDLI